MLTGIRVLTLLSALALPGSAQRTKLSPDFNIFSIAQDVELGRIAAQEVEAGSAIVRDADVVSYLDALGRNLASKAPGSNQFHFQFRIIDDKRINAFGAPGGIVFVNRGAIEAAANEAQLASVIAHEIGHVVLRHGTHQLSKAYAMQVPISSLGAVGRTSIPVALAKTAGSFTASSILLKNPREAEDQADLLGVQIVYDAGYDPEAAIRFFEIVQTQAKDAQRPVSHPETVNRIANVSREIEKLGGVRSNAIIDSPRFQDIKAVLLRLP
jgi:predicted Zn-dependent protease